MFLAIGSLEVNWNRIYEGLDRGAKFGLGVMDPIFSGRWTDISEGIVESLPEAALRIVLSKGEVRTALAGVSSLEQLEQSVAWAEKGPLAKAAIEGLAKVWCQFPLD